jgi:hypothetical protein
MKVWVIWIFGNWDLFGAWDLVIGIYFHCDIIHTLWGKSPEAVDW